MKHVFHNVYGYGTASEPYLQYGQQQIDVSFKSKSITFLFPLVFEKGILTIINEIPTTSILQKSSPLEHAALNALIVQYIEDFMQKKNYDFVVKDSLPIVWFGNINDYQKSSKRILTIGLNPSKEEFPQSVPRFEHIDFTTANESAKTLENTINYYFSNNPYTKWFSKYNKLLNALNASYGGIFEEKENTAIHIDIYSAIATDPTWGHLSDAQKTLLQRPDLFDSLLSLLDPDIILISVNRKIFNNHFGDWEHISENQFLGNNYISLYRKNNKMLILGTNFQGIPFGGIKEELVIDKIQSMILK